MPVAVFALGPRSDDEQAWRRSRSQLDRALAKQPQLGPVAVALFGGADPPRFGGSRAAPTRTRAATRTRRREPGAGGAANVRT